MVVYDGLWCAANRGLAVTVRNPWGYVSHTGSAVAGHATWVVYGVAGRGSDWLGSYDWAPHTWCVDGKAYPVVQQGVESLMGKVTTSAECKKCDMLLPVPGRSYEHGGKGAPRSPNQPVKAVGHSFQNKT